MPLQGYSGTTLKRRNSETGPNRLIARQSYAHGRNTAQVFAATPVVDSDVLDVCHPSAAVVTEAPGVLEPRPPAPVSFDLDGPWGVKLRSASRWTSWSTTVLRVDPAG